MGGVLRRAGDAVDGEVAEPALAAVPAIFLLAAGVAAVAAPTSLNPCPSWSDDYGFDCQLYEGADWCTSQGQPGAGWCQSSPDSTCLPNAAPNSKFGWGSF